MLELHSVSKTFHPGTANERRAIDRLDLSVGQGEFLVVVGGNGSGKSTVMNAVAGVFPVDEGRIRIGGRDITRLAEHARAVHIGRVFQDPMLGTAPDMTIADNLALAMRRGKRRGLRPGIGRRERGYYESMLARLELGLETRLNTRVGLLSGGQRQALTLLMAVMKTPALLMLDEHTAALDPKTARRVLKLTDFLIREQGLTALMVTHNMADALRYGDRLVMLEQGRVAFEAQGEEKRALTPAALMERFKGRDVVV